MGLTRGFKEFGETLEEAARRELPEETGLSARTLRFLTICSGSEFAHTYPNGDRIEQVAAIYQAVDVEGNIQPDMKENLELRYFNVRGLLSPMQSLSEPLLSRALEVLAD